jgi:hypothetical protein
MNPIYKYKWLALPRAVGGRDTGAITPPPPDFVKEGTDEEPPE